MDKDPLVSIGIPVFNGEKFLPLALDSVLAQTFADFEIIICDNASTDATETICRSYAARDSRIRYFRNEKNLGSAPNCNLTFRHARGRYFKWACHDDMLEPDFLEKTVARLEEDPTIVVCHSLVRVIDGDGKTLDIHDSKLTGAESASLPERFRTMALEPHQCLELDGLIRSSALAQSDVVPSYASGDRALLVELALLGRIVRVEEPIFLTREHPDRFRRIANTPEERLAFYDTSRSGKKTIATLELYLGYWKKVHRHVKDPRDRRRCFGILLRWWFVNWNAARVLVDVLALISPSLLVRAERFKQRIFSPEPGPDISGSERAG